MAQWAYLERSACSCSIRQAVSGYWRFERSCQRLFVFKEMIWMVAGMIWSLLSIALRIVENSVAEWINRQLFFEPLLYGIGFLFMPRFYGAAWLRAEELDGSKRG